MPSVHPAIRSLAVIFQVILMFSGILGLLLLLTESKVVKTSKTKKKNRRRKEPQKNTPGNDTSTSNSTSLSSNAVHIDKVGIIPNCSLYFPFACRSCTNPTSI